MTQINILRAVDRRAETWKNGGGTTCEVAAFPPGSDVNDFLWRISIANVRVGGPFSHFPQIDRTIAIVSGTLRLSSGGKVVKLSTADSPFAFPGDVPTIGEPVDGPVRDLNIMTRRHHYRATTLRLVPEDVVTERGAATIVLIALTDAQLKIGKLPVMLEALDAIELTSLHRTTTVAVTAGRALLVRLYADLEAGG